MKRHPALIAFTAFLVVLVINGLLLRTNHSLVLPLGNSGHKTLLLMFTPTCPYCKANWPNWSELAERSKSQTRIVWGDLSGTATPAYLASHNVQMAPDNTIQVGAESRDIDSFHVTPTTVMLDSSGKVQGVWLGILDDQKRRELDALLNE